MESQSFQRKLSGASMDRVNGQTSHDDSTASSDKDWSRFYETRKMSFAFFCGALSHLLIGTRSVDLPDVCVCVFTNQSHNSSGASANESL